MTATIQKPVTGHKEIPSLSDPLAALAQFYRALNSRDLELMKQNWDPSDEAVMDNPRGGIKRGWAEIGEVYRRLFGSPKIATDRDAIDQ
jgi:hypothetical protein